MSDFEMDHFLLPFAATTFTCFPKLPMELQLQIWESADQDPMAVKIIEANHRVVKRCDGEDFEREVVRLQAKAIYTIPPMLHACRTARAVALPGYELCFEEYLGHPVYFRYGLDELHFEEPNALCSFLKTPWFADLQVKSTELSRIRWLSFGVQWVHNQRRISDRLFSFHGLERISFREGGWDCQQSLSIWKTILDRRWGKMAQYKMEVHGDFTMNSKAPIVELSVSG